MRDQKSKESLIKHLQNSKDERLWQAIKNWSGYKYILESDNGFEGRDTFFIEADEEMEE